MAIASVFPCYSAIASASSEVISHIVSYKSTVCSSIMRECAWVIKIKGFQTDVVAQSQKKHIIHQMDEVIPSSCVKALQLFDSDTVHET